MESKWSGSTGGSTFLLNIMRDLWFVNGRLTVCSQKVSLCKLEKFQFLIANIFFFSSLSKLI